MARQVLNLFLQPVPADHPPTVWIRRVDVAVFSGVVVAALAYILLGWLLWRPIMGTPTPEGGLGQQLAGYPEVLLSLISSARLFPHAVVDNPAFGSMSGVHWRLFPSAVLALALGSFVLRVGLTPWRRMKHIEGPQLLDGDEARAAAVRQLTDELRGKEPFMHLGPLPISKERATRGILLVGSPGSGKSVVLHPIIQGFILRDDKAWIFDSKSDFTAAYLGGTVALISPWDKRSHVWDIARDAVSPSDAAGLAASLIPKNDKDPYWSQGAAMLFEGTLQSLQNELGTEWGWATLSERLNVDLAAYAERMARHMPKAEALVADPKSQASASLLATLQGFTKLVDDLALAWGDGRDSAGNMRPHFSFRDWIRDDYEGRFRQVIVQAGPDPNATSTLASALVNAFLPALLSPATPDSFERTIGLFLDELPSIGPVNFAAALERGRSRGLIVCASVQDLAQVEAVWSVQIRKTLTSMFGTQVVYRMAPSGSRDEIADSFGKARWAVTAVSANGTGSGTTSVHEENRAAVTPHEIGMLGKIEPAPFPLGWGIRAMVWLGGASPDVYTIDFEGVAAPRRRTPHRAASWTLGPAKPGQKAELTTTQKRAASVARQEAWQSAKASDDAAKVRSRPAPIRESRPPKDKGTTVAANPGAAAKILAERATSPLANAAAAMSRE